MLTPNSIPIPARRTLTPPESASISSVTFPTPKNIGAGLVLWNSWHAMIDSTILALFTGSSIKSATYLIPSVSLISWCIASTRSEGDFGDLPWEKLVGSNTAGMSFSFKIFWTSELFPKSRLNTKSMPFSAATCISFGFSVSILSGLSPTIGLKVSISSGILSEKSSPAAIPMSIMSAPESTKYWHLLISASFERNGALAISDNTLIGKSSPTGRFLISILFGFFRSSLIFSSSFSNSSMNLNASLRFSSSISLSAGLSSDRSMLPIRFSTIARSAPSVEPLNVGIPSSFVISFVPFLISPGTRIMSISSNWSLKDVLTSLIICLGVKNAATWVLSAICTIISSFEPETTSFIRGYANSPVIIKTFMNFQPNFFIIIL